MVIYKTSDHLQLIGTLLTEKEDPQKHFEDILSKNDETDNCVSPELCLLYTSVNYPFSLTDLHQKQ